MTKLQWDKPLLTALSNQTGFSDKELKQEIRVVAEALGYTDLLKIPVEVAV